MNLNVFFVEKTPFWRVFTDDWRNWAASCHFCEFYYKKTSSLIAKPTGSEIRNKFHLMRCSKRTRHACVSKKETRSNPKIRKTLTSENDQK